MKGSAWILDLTCSFSFSNSLSPPPLRRMLRTNNLGSSQCGDIENIDGQVADQINGDGSAGSCEWGADATYMAIANVLFLICGILLCWYVSIYRLGFGFLTAEFIFWEETFLSVWIWSLDDSS